MAAARKNPRGKNPDGYQMGNEVWKKAGDAAKKLKTAKKKAEQSPPEEPKPAPLPVWMTDKSKLPKRPPGKGET